MTRPLATLLLLLTTMIWGFAFLAQKSGMATMGPLTFAAARYTLGGLVILPLAVWEFRRKRVPDQPTLSAHHWGLILAMSTVFFLGSWLQQTGLLTTTVTNAGFLTSLYVLFVPLIALVALRVWPHPVVWLGVPLALGGIYLLNGGVHGFNSGDALIIACAVFWALHVLLLGHTARVTGLPIIISAVSFLVAGALASLAALAFETPSWAGIIAGWLQLAYAAVLSTAVAFTLQAIAQRHVPAANAAIIMSAESLFAALGGALIFGERLPMVGYLGAALIFAAIVLVEVIPALRARAIAAAPGSA